MRICFFFHRFDGGGAEKMTICLANELANRGHEITIAVRYNYGTAKTSVNSNVKILDLKLPVNGKLVKNIKNVNKLCKIMNSGRFDIIAAVMAEMAEVAAIAQFLSNKNTILVCILHNTLSIEKTSFQRIRRRLFDYFDSQYNYIIAVSDSVKTDYINICPQAAERIRTIYNPVVNTEINEMMQECPSHPWLVKSRDWITLIMAGRLTYQKNYKLALNVLKELVQEGKYKLIILGDGEQKEYLEDYARQLNIENEVDFQGYRTNPYSYIAHGDCFLLSSHYEGLPTVLIEALACGSRIVSVDCPSGPREILKNGEYGELTEPDNVESMKKAIVSIMEKHIDKDLLLKRAEDFSVEKSVKQYEQLFLSLVMSRGR